MCPICMHLDRLPALVGDGIVEGHRRALGGHRPVPPPALLQTRPM